jgi:hypothetical protein
MIPRVDFDYDDDYKEQYFEENSSNEESSYLCLSLHR